MTLTTVTLDDFADIAESAVKHTWQDLPSSNMRIHTIATPDGQINCYAQEGEAAVRISGNKASSNAAKLESCL